ncbi:MAG: type I-MYXAN CRISPR-associated protein Cas5/Cmx5/DevS [Deltaproteobacteria bacterium]|nr:type I-MYXAN CRISPR-associated protein Cas5/Cmx5/DevS [Deltaproteobacteria bacterium]
MSQSDALCLRVTAPICSFRKGYAREYLETEEVPPPSTVYGFLLSLVGEEDRRAYLGTKLAYALLAKPEVSTVLRTVWRVKELKVKKTGLPQPPGVGTNRRPDFQEILSGLDLAIWVRDGALASRLRQSAASPGDVRRFGGLSLGESRDLVNDIWWYPAVTGLECRWLTPDAEGDLPLPVWVDHVGSKETVWRQFRLELGTAHAPTPSGSRWIVVEGPS